VLAEAPVPAPAIPASEPAALADTQAPVTPIVVQPTTLDTAPPPSADAHERAVEAIKNEMAKQMEEQPAVAAPVAPVEPSAPASVDAPAADMPAEAAQADAPAADTADAPASAPKVKKLRSARKKILTPEQIEERRQRGLAKAAAKKAAMTPEQIEAQKAAKAEKSAAAKAAGEAAGAAMTADDKAAARAARKSNKADARKAKGMARKEQVAAEVLGEAAAPLPATHEDVVAQQPDASAVVSAEAAAPQPAVQEDVAPVTSDAAAPAASGEAAKKTYAVIVLNPDGSINLRETDNNPLNRVIAEQSKPDVVVSNPVDTNTNGGAHVEAAPAAPAADANGSAHVDAAPAAPATDAHPGDAAPVAEAQHADAKDENKEKHPDDKPLIVSGTLDGPPVNVAADEAPAEKHEEAAPHDAAPVAAG
jgi:hypothetical protein